MLLTKRKYNLYGVDLRKSYQISEIQILFSKLWWGYRTIGAGKSIQEHFTFYLFKINVGPAIFRPGVGNLINNIRIKRAEYILINRTKPNTSAMEGWIEGSKNLSFYFKRNHLEMWSLAGLIKSQGESAKCLYPYHHPNILFLLKQTGWGSSKL